MIFTIGYGLLEQSKFINLLEEAEVELLIDVRSVPKSRRQPQFNNDQIQSWLPIDYIWLQNLGGLKKQRNNLSKHTALTHDSFRSYADYMETDVFKEGIAELLVLANGKNVAFFCCETLWWRCHRKLIADYLTAIMDLNIFHIMHDGNFTIHEQMACSRIEGNNLIYDGG